MIAKEEHISGNSLRDVILGGQDGLVNVLGIVLGVAAAGGGNKILIAASLAAAFAEAVSMAAVAYTSAVSQRNHYQKELARETQEIETVPEIEREEIRDVYRKKGFTGELLEKIVEKITGDKPLWLKTMMEEELDLKNVETKSILQSALIVGIAALIASFIPIWPFFFLPTFHAALLSLLTSGIALFIVGVYEAKTYVGVWWHSGVKMVTIGLGAAFVGFLIGKIFQV